MQNPLAQKALLIYSSWAAEIITHRSQVSRRCIWFIMN
jgi:hypothetical protein